MLRDDVTQASLDPAGIASAVAVPSGVYLADSAFNFDSLPADITLQATFSMFHNIRVGNSIFFTDYKSHGDYRASLFSFCVIESLNGCEKMRELFDAGAELLRRILPTVPEDLRTGAEYMYHLSNFPARSSETARNAKRWYLAKLRLTNMCDERRIAHPDLERMDAGTVRKVVTKKEVY